MKNTEYSAPRRTLLKAAATTLILPFWVSLPQRRAMAQAQINGDQTAATSAISVGAYLEMGGTPSSPGTFYTRIFIGSSEMGQGIMTSMAQIVADQLNLSWECIRVEHGIATNPVNDDGKGVSANNPFKRPGTGSQLTAASTSCNVWQNQMASVASRLREMLIATAGPGWALSSNANYLKSGSSQVHYVDLIEDAYKKFVNPGGTSVPTAQILPTKNFVGSSPTRLDIPAKINGSALFGIDIGRKTRSAIPGGGDLADLHYAAIIHSPRFGGVVAGLPTAPQGVELFTLKLLSPLGKENAVGVVSPHGTWEAMSAAKSIASKIKWSYSAITNPAEFDSGSVITAATSLARAERLPSAESPPKAGQLLRVEGADGREEESGTALAELKTKFESSTYKVDQVYTCPNLAHAAMEVVNCTVKIHGTGINRQCEIWAPTQGQDSCIGTAASFLGIDRSKVIVHTTFLGGAFGRKIEQDFIGQAVQLAAQTGKPVKLVWSREEDFKNDWYRPSAAIRVRMGASLVDQKPKISSLIYRAVTPSISASRGRSISSNGDCAGATNLPYVIGTSTTSDRRIEHVTVPNQIPLGFWRSVGESYNTFAIESAIDELASACGFTSIDQSIQFRLDNLDDDRAKAVILEAQRLSGGPGVKLARGAARGVAFMEGFGSYVALILEVAGTASNPRVLNAFCAVDCGICIHPDSVAAQVEGSIIQGLSSALWGRMAIVSGTPQAANFDRYRLMQMSETPNIRISILASTKTIADAAGDRSLIGGVGEVGVPCVAPALANALVRLGTRKRSLPII